jgi:hypothetical protein
LVQEESISKVVIKGREEYSYWSLIKTPPNLGDWERLTSVVPAATGGQWKRDLTTDPLIFNIDSTSSSYIFKFSFRLKVRSARELTWTVNNSGAPVLSTATQSTTVTTSGSQRPISSTNVNLLLPSNFSEISGGGVQVVTNNNQYVKIPRNAPAAAASVTVLETKGGKVELDNQGQDALKVTGDMEMNGNIDATDKSIHFKYLNSYSYSTVKEYPLPYIHKGSMTISLGQSSADHLHVVSFPSVGTSSYYVLGNLVGSTSSSGTTSWNTRNDCIATIFAKTTTSFTIAIREVSNHNTTIYFEYVLVYPYN